MVGRKLFLILGLFASACAEIMPLSGGESDESAPVVVEQYPEQGALYVSTNLLKLRFDEYFQLVDPANTVMINPSLGKLTVEQTQKKLTVEWQDTLQKNTTYTIQLNGTVKDLNEGNDTILQLAFSTGGQLDTLSIKGMVSGVLNNEAKSQISVGLYSNGANPLTDKPTYATRTTSKGEFKFSYLPDAKFQLYAFNDKNKNQTIDPTEEVGFQSTLVASTDTNLVAVRLFPPKIAKTRVQVVLNNPGIATVFNRDSLVVDSLRINGVNTELIRQITKDSMQVLLPESPNENWQFTYQNDTVFKTRDAKLKLEKLKPIIQNKEFIIGDSIHFFVNDKLVALDTQFIGIETELKDSLPFTYRLSKNELILKPTIEKGKKATIVFKQKAFSGASSSNDTLRFQLPIYGTEDLSILKLSLENFSGQWIVQLMNGKEIVQSKLKTTDLQAIRFEQVVSGNYTIKCIQDLNTNGQWDTGNLSTKLQAETIINFTLKQKMRPNWEVEETLQYKP